MLIYPFGTIAFTLRFIFGPPFLCGEWYDNAIDGLAINLVALGVINMFVPTLLAIRSSRALLTPSRTCSSCYCHSITC